MKNAPKFLLSPPVLAAFIALAVTVIAISNPLDTQKSDTPVTNHSSAAYNKTASCKGCHPSGGNNSGGGSAAVTGVPRMYTPGNIYPLTIRVSQTGKTRWGYQMTSTDKAGNGSGNFVNPGNNSQIQADSGREFVSHQLGGTWQGVPDGPVFWSVDWVAPPAGSGTVYFWMSGTACDNDLTEFGDDNYNFARASAESGTGHPDATIMTQPDFPVNGDYTISRSTGDHLETEMRVSSHLFSIATFTVVTRVKLPSGGFYPPSGYLTTDSLTLDPGKTGTVSFSEFIPPSAPLGVYEFQAIVGYAPSTFVDIFTFEFEVVP